jgi:DNA-binding NtrC family response regulator
MGTTFRIYLPLTKPAAEGREAETLVAPQGGTETVLIAEDDREVRRLTLQLLSEYGYTIIEAVDGEDAINKFIENKNTVSLLILDVIMPKKNGNEAYKAISKIRPDVKALFVSGYSAEIFHHKGILEKGLDFISKPVSPDKLLKTVREILDRQKKCDASQQGALGAPGSLSAPCSGDPRESSETVL